MRKHYRRLKGFLDRGILEALQNPCENIIRQISLLISGLTLYEIAVTNCEIVLCHTLRKCS